MILKLSFCDLAVLRLRGVGRDRALIKFQMVGSLLGFASKLFPFYSSSVSSASIRSTIRFNSNTYTQNHKSDSTPNDITYNADNRSLIISGKSYKLANKNIKQKSKIKTIIIPFKELS
jgi:hypothetical protein